MTSKEYIKAKLEYLIRYEPSLSFDIDMFEQVLKDLDSLEVLKKENKKWREIVGCDLCEALGREILLEENEKLKKQVEDLENNKRGSK